MPALPNAKHERFAQSLASGVSQADAYQQAGYKRHTGNASSLAQDKSILERVAEILTEREHIHAQATAKAIEATALTKEWVIERLVENVDRAMQAKAALDSEGEPTGEYKYEGSVANKALELLGKELGMFVERTENVNTNYAVSGDPVDNVEEWEAEHAPKH